MANNREPLLPAAEPAKRINVINPYGDPENIDPSELEQALKVGYKPMPQEQVQALQDQQDYGQGVGNMAGAFAAGAARGATFGLSDQALTKTGLVAPETLAKQKQYNPGSAIAGEVAGVGAGLLAPELEGAAALLNPVGAVAKAGRAVTEGAAALAAPSEAAGLASKILSGASAHGLGSAVEGAAYGLGQSVSEDALGDPSLNGEKVLSNVGYSALLGGGIGALFGGALAPFQKAQASALTEAARPAMESGDISEAVQASTLSPAEKAEFKRGLGELRPDAPAIQSAAEELGAPLSPAQLSANKTVRNTFDALVNGPPTVAGQRQAALAKQGWDVAIQAADGAMGEGANLSKAQAGEILQNQIASRFEGELAPTKQLYNEIEPYAQAIPITDRSTNSIARNIRGIIESEGLIRGTAEHDFVNTMADGLDQITDLQRLKNFRTAMARSVTPENRFAASLVREKLDNLETNAIKRYAETMKTPVAKERILGLIGKIEDAKSGYKAWRDKASEFAGVLGKRKIYGPQDFLDFIHDTTPEKFADKLFAKNNSRFMDFFSKQFPEEMETMKKYRLGELKDLASKKGYFDPRELFRQVDKLSPEMKGVLFTPDQLDKLGTVRTYLQSFPEKFNPSNTSNSEAIRHFFSGPTAAVAGNVRDFAMEQFINHAVKFDPETGHNISHLVKIERMASDTSRAVLSGAKSIFKSGAAIAVPTAAFSAGSFEKTKEDLGTMTSSPETLIDKLDEHTRAMYPVAPQTSGAVQQAALRAMMFLNSKLPQTPPPKPFSPKFTPSQNELNRFGRYHAAIENPTGILNQVAQGFVTPEAIEAVQTVYPKLYAEMKSAVMDELTSHLEKKRDLPYQKRIALAQFLDTDLDHSTEQASILANQVALAQGAGGPEVQGGAPGGSGNTPRGKLGKISSSQRMLTSLQATAQREA